MGLSLLPPISREEALTLAEKFPPDVGFVHYPNRYRSTNWVRMLLRYYELGIPFPTTTTEMVCTDDTYLIHETDRELLDRYDDRIDDRLPCIYNEVIVARLGPMPIVAMQGEICAPIGARIKDAFRADMPIMVFGYMGEHKLYIRPASWCVWAPIRHRCSRLSMRHRSAGRPTSKTRWSTA